MGQATSMATRQKIAYLSEQGTSYLQLSKNFKLAYNTVRNLCRAYKKPGIEGLQTKYDNCGNKGKIRSNLFIHRCCIFLRTKHPSWGVTLTLILFIIYHYFNEQKIANAIRQNYLSQWLVKL